MASASEDDAAKIRLAGLLAAANAPSELMKLRKAEAVGVLDDHNRGVCDVHAHFDDGGADQHVDIPRA